MDFKLLSKDKGKVRFIVKGTSPAQLNTVRRTIINSLPAMAIDTIEFVENSSALYDEMLAHRLGLLVLKTDTKSYFIREKCKCKGAGCARCTLDLTLEKEGPCTVYAEDIKSKDPSVIPVHGKTPIVKLLEGQKLKLIAKAILGTGKEHTKFSPGLLWYQGYPTISTSKVTNPEAIAKICPKKVFTADKKSLKVKDKESCILCMACVDASNGNVKVNGSDKDFIVTLEPWGQLTAKEIITGVNNIVSEELDTIAATLKKTK